MFVSFSELRLNEKYFNLIADLYNKFNKVQLGYNETETTKPEDMEFFYSKEEQQKYGVVGIEIKIIKD